MTTAPERERRIDQQISIRPTIEAPWTALPPVRLGSAPAGQVTPDAFVLVKENGKPCRRFDIYLGPSHFALAAIAWNDWFVFGFDDRVTLVSQTTGQQHDLCLENYFVGFHAEADYLLALSGIGIARLDESGAVIWKNDDLGLDGVIVDHITHGMITGQGEWDPPGGWRPFRLSLADGKPCVEIPEPSRTALVLVDLQNDFLHPQGAYGRAGVSAPAIAALPDRLAPVAAAIRRAGGWIVSTHFTLVPGKGGEPFITPHLKKLRPFLGKGDFAPGSFGHDLVDALKPADLTIEKVAYSAFHMSRMEFVLDRAGIDTLIFAGIVTNGGVASTLRDAHVRDYRVILIADGCAAFRDDVHAATVASLASIAEVTDCAGVIAALGP
jgi:ureidoacrylate peracid hydrolase